MDFLLMGSVGRPHGIRGEMWVNWAGETLPEPGQQIFLQAGDAQPEARRVAASRMHNGRLMLSVDGVSDRDSAERLTGSKVFMRRSSVKQPGDDEAFVADLPGCEVFLPDGKPAGRLKQVQFPSGKMIWAIEGLDGKEILFPAEPEFIRKLDMGARKIVIDPPPGLLEIYSA